MSDFFPELRFLIDNRDYFNTIITNNDLKITPRIRRLRGRPRHIYDQLLRIAFNRAEYSHTFVRMANEFLRVFPDYRNGWLRNKLYQRRVYREYDNDSVSSTEVQHERDPNNGRREHIRPSRREAMNNLATRMYIGQRLEQENVDEEAFRIYRAMRRGDITEETYEVLTRHLQERNINFTMRRQAPSMPWPEVRMPGPNEYVNRPVVEDLLGTIVIDTTIPPLERAHERSSVDAFVEHLLVRPNVKITDWKEEKPDECPVCCGDCDEYPLSCGHYVCSDCIVNSKKATCPCCRQDVALDIPVYQRLYNAIYN